MSALFTKMACAISLAMSCLIPVGFPLWPRFHLHADKHSYSSCFDCRPSVVAAEQKTDVKGRWACVGAPSSIRNQFALPKMWY